MATTRTIPVVSTLLSVVNSSRSVFQPPQTTSFFDEGPRVANAKQPSLIDQESSLSNLSSSYAWTQGIEMNRQAMYDAGLAKIWSGDQGHQLKPSVFGQDKGNPPVKGHPSTPNFTDSDRTDPVKVILAAPVANSLIATNDSSRLGDFYFNGTLEPLSIRKSVGLFLGIAPAEAHVMRGALAGGNIDISTRSDRVLTVDYFTAKPSPVGFLDVVDMTGNRPSNEYFQSKLTSVPAFVDARYVRNVPSSEDAKLLNALSLMTGSTANYVSYDQRSATCGWDYDHALPAGTDSLAFGGMTH